jgi:hypothetical protein
MNRLRQARTRVDDMSTNYGPMQRDTTRWNELSRFLLGVSQMLTDPGAMLRVLFGIPPAQIDSDVAEGERDFDRLLGATHAYYLENAGSEDPKIAAQLHHKELVRA